MEQELASSYNRRFPSYGHSGNGNSLLQSSQITTQKFEIQNKIYSWNLREKKVNNYFSTRVSSRMCIRNDFVLQKIMIQMFSWNYNNFHPYYNPCKAYHAFIVLFEQSQTTFLK